MAADGPGRVLKPQAALAGAVLCLDKWQVQQQKKRDLQSGHGNMFRNTIVEVVCGGPVPVRLMICESAAFRAPHLKDVAGQAPQPRLDLSQLHFQKRAAQGVPQQQACVPSPDHHIQALLLQRQGEP